MRAAFFGSCFALCLVAFRADAQVGVAVLLPARGDERMTSQRETAQRALHEALSAQGYRVTTHAEALSQLPQGTAACSAVDCSPNMLRALSADVAAACAVWLSPDAPEGTVFVTLVDDAGARFPGAHAVHAGTLEVATRAALAEARGLQLLGPGPWVRVRGTPASAKVLIDGQVVGALPYRAAMTAGRYSLRIESPGHLSEEQTLDIPLNAGRVVEVEVNLEVGEDPVVASPPVERATSVPVDDNASATEHVAGTGDYLLGGTLAVAGVLLMTIDPIPAALLHGDTVPGRPERRYSFGPRATLEVIGGAALVAAGALVTFVWKPFSLQVSTGSQTSLQLSTRF